MNCLKDRVHLIPAELKSLKQWVLWRIEIRNGRETKVPYALTGQKASTTDAATWASFNDVLAAYHANPSAYSGIGFVFTKDDPYCGIDLDDALDADGELKSWAAKITGAMNCYSEVSPSGTGVKVWIKGKLPGDRHRTKYEDGEVEMYDKERYFTVTAHNLPGVSLDIEERQEQLNDLYAKVFAKPKKAETTEDAGDMFDAPPPVTAVDGDADEDEGVGAGAGWTDWDAVAAVKLSDEEVIQRASGAANGDSFRTLWSGDVSGYGDDDSRADLALCALLAFWTGKDRTAMDRLFRKSKLYRDKWDRADYRDRTIEKACQTVAETYAAAAPPAATTAPAAGRTLDCLPASDLGNARRLILRHGQDLRYVPGIGWHVWTNQVWEPDVTGEVVRRAKATAELIPQEFSPCKRRGRHKDILKWSLTSESHAKLTAMVDVAQTEPGIAVRPEQLDTRPYLLAVQNGTVDLRTGQLLPHRRDDLLTKISPVAYDPDAACPVFDAFMARIFSNNQPLIDYVLGVLGHCLTGDISLEHLWVFYGGGANGKSTLLGIVQYLMGGYAGSAPESLLCSSKREEHPTELADLQGRRLVIASETESNARLKLQLIKRLTGEPTIKARRMRMDFYEFPRTHKTILMTNNKPRVREDTEAVWRRLRLIPFTVEIPAAERDPQLGRKLRAEASGVLTRLVAGCLRWQREGLIDPPEVMEATNEYRAESDPLGDFIAERCLIAPNGWVSTSALYGAYMEFCKKFGDHYLSGKEFAARLSRRDDCHPAKRRGMRGWSGLTLVERSDNTVGEASDDWLSGH